MRASPSAKRLPMGVGCKCWDGAGMAAAAAGRGMLWPMSEKTGLESGLDNVDLAKCLLDAGKATAV